MVLLKEYDLNAIGPSNVFFIKLWWKMMKNVKFEVLHTVITETQYYTRSRKKNCPLVLLLSNNSLDIPPWHLPGILLAVVVNGKVYRCFIIWFHGIGPHYPSLYEFVFDVLWVDIHQRAYMRSKGIYMPNSWLAKGKDPKVLLHDILGIISTWDMSRIIIINDKLLTYQPFM